MADAIKKAMAQAITEFVNGENFMDEVFGVEDPLVECVEVYDTSPLENTIKVWPKVGGGPRYFTVKVSENI
jgi:hypothetical protein